MKKRLTAIMMTAALACGTLIACGSEAETTEETTETATEASAEESTEENADATDLSDAITGEVTAVAETSFTISTDDGEIEVTVTDDTVYMIGNHGGDGEAPSGDGEAKEKPEGEAPSEDGEAPADMPEGEAPSGDGEAPADNGGAQDASFDDITEGSQVTVTLDSDGNALTVEISNE